MGIARGILGRQEKHALKVPPISRGKMKSGVLRPFTYVNVAPPAVEDDGLTHPHPPFQKVNRLLFFSPSNRLLSLKTHSASRNIRSLSRCQRPNGPLATPPNMLNVTLDSHQQCAIRTLHPFTPSRWKTMSERPRGRRRKRAATVARDAGKRKQRSLGGVRGDARFFLHSSVFSFSCLCIVFVF